MRQPLRLFTLLLALVVVSLLPGATISVDAHAAAPDAPTSSQGPQPSAPGGVIVGRDYKHDVSPPLRTILPAHVPPRPARQENPPRSTGIGHTNAADPVVQSTLAPLAMPSTLLNFNGIPFPGVACNCAPPDTNGEAGATQYVQIVNEGYQVFNKSTGGSEFGPVSISTIWSGFGGVCETSGHGDPVLLYDQIAGRWLVSQFAGSSIPTDECIALSTTSDAAGSYNRYAFHLGNNFFDYPHLGVWPDGYYMSMNVFNSAGTSYLGPQAFAFDRSKMLAGQSATFISPGGALGGSVDPFLPADLDGSTLPPAGAPNTFVGFPGLGAYTTYHFHADFTTPSNSTFTTFASPAAAGFTQLCPTTRACVPQAGVSSINNLDAIADRLMFRLAYRNFGDHESIVGNYTVSFSGVAGIRWFELRNVTFGPVTKYQESTYQPDTIWRWMGSAAMDQQGNLAVGFSASSGSINPQIRYAGRLATDPLNQLAQGEAVMFSGTGSQTGTSNRWGDYSDLTVDPVDDCTFWYTTEYYASTSSFNWRTRIGSFKFAGCGSAATVPGAPVLSGSAGNGVVHLTWSAPSNNGSAITNYKVYRGTTPGGEALLTTLGNVTSYDDTAVTNGTTYYYMVSAVNGVGEGVQSNEVSATPQAATAPSAPQNLAAAARGKAIQVSWSPPASNGGSTITGYRIYRGTSPGGESFYTAVGNVTSFKDTSLVSGTSYYYKVTAVNAVGESPQSNEASARAR